MSAVTNCNGNEKDYKPLKGKRSKYNKRYSKVILQHDIGWWLKNTWNVESKSPIDLPHFPDVTLFAYHLFQLMVCGLTDQLYNTSRSFNVRFQSCPSHGRKYLLAIDNNLNHKCITDLFHIKLYTYYISVHTVRQLGNC